MGAGLLVSAIFNPYDRALFLSSVHARPFFDNRNWGGGKSFAGLLPSLMQRSISYGLYFPLEGFYLSLLSGATQTLNSSSRGGGGGENNTIGRTKSSLGNSSLGEIRETPVWVTILEFPKAYRQLLLGNYLLDFRTNWESQF